MSMMSLAKIHCAMFGHAYHVHQRFSSHARRVICLRCGGDWGMNDQVRALIPWDSELEALYRDVFEIQIVNP